MFSRVTFCIPTYNRAEQLRSLLQHLCSFEKISPEIAISDNASSDSTQEIVSDFSDRYPNIRYKRQEKLVGPTLNFFAAVHQATSEYIMFLGDDDSVDERVILQTLGYIEANPKLSAVVGGFDKIDPTTGETSGHHYLTDKEKVLTQNSRAELFSLGHYLENGIFRRDIYQQFFHNTAFSYPVGWEFLDICLSKGPVLVAPGPIMLKGDGKNRDGRKNYQIQVQDFSRADIEVFMSRSWRKPRRSKELASVHSCAVAKMELFLEGSIQLAAHDSLPIAADHYLRKRGAYGTPSSARWKENFDWKWPLIAARILALVESLQGVHGIAIEQVTDSDKLASALSSRNQEIDIKQIPSSEMLTWQTAEGVFLVAGNYSILSERQERFATPPEWHVALDDLLNVDFCLE